MTTKFKLFIGAAIAAAFITAGVTAALGTTSSPRTVSRLCVYVQGGHGATVGDLNVLNNRFARYRVCIVGKRGKTGATGATGPAGPQGDPGKVTGTVAVCASNGGNLKLCGGDEGHDPVGYLTLTN